MICPTHNSEAVGICSYCGRAVCAQCPKPSGPRLVCSDTCAAALAQADKAMETILQKSVQNTRASAFYYFLCAAGCAAGAVGANFYFHVPFLTWFMGGCSVLFAIAGFWYLRIARKQS